MRKIFNHLQTTMLLGMALTLVGCGSPTLTKKRLDLDPEVEAQVKAINLERFGGTWTTELPRGTVYFDISADGYYMTATRKSDEVTVGDFGSIDHYKPGVMLLYSDRPECDEDGKATVLTMDRLGDVVKASDTTDRSVFMELVAVSKRERIETLPCMR